MFQSIKDWFKRSETIFLARLEALVGFVILAFSVMDWSPLISIGMSTGFTWGQIYMLGIIMVIKGGVSEWARRINTKEIEGHLLPTEVKVVGKTETKVELEIKKEEEDDD